MIIELPPFNIKLCIYVIVCIIILTWGTMKVNDHYQMMGAVLYFAGALYVCIIYGIRWFGTPTSETTSWPPTINTCPDYLTYVERTKSGVKVPSCVDTIGVSTKAFEMIPKGTDPTDPSTDSKYFFDLTTTTNNKNQELCERALNAGLTWEGITNGDGCISQNGTASSTSGGVPKCKP
jgi:hypothetical protein